MKGTILVSLDVSIPHDIEPGTIKKAVNEMIETLSTSDHFNDIMVVGGEIMAATLSTETNNPITPKGEHDCATCPQELYDRCVTLPAHEKAKRRLAARLN